MLPQNQKKEARLLFVNKSASNTSLSHSEADEGLNIRRFIQRRNRRIERAAKRALPASLTQEPASRQIPTEGARWSSDFRTSTTETIRTTRQNPTTAIRDDHIEGTECLRKWVYYSTRAYNQGSPAASLTVETTDRQSTSRGGRKGTNLYKTIQQRGCWSPVERRGSDYFMTAIAAKFTSAECSIFWSVFLPCVFEQDLHVRLLATGLALMHESFDLQERDPQQAQNRYEQALVSCNKAIACIRTSAEAMTKISLDMTCILIVSIEILRGDLAAAEACLDSGLAMAGTSRAEIVQRRWQHPISPNDSTSCQRAIEVTQAKMSGAFHVFGIKSERNEPPVKFHPVLPPPLAHGLFMSLEDVNTLAEVLYSATLRAIESSPDRRRFSHGSEAANAMLEGFENFHRGLKAIHASDPSSASASEAFTQTTIQEVKVLEAQIVFNCVVLDNDDMSFDNWNWAFEKILQGVTNKLESSVLDPFGLTYHPFSAVYVAPLWLTASRCRVPTLRRRAIHLLRTYRRRETVYDSLIAANLAQRIMTMEEGCEARVETCTDVQRSQRISLVAAEYVSARGYIRLKFVRGSVGYAEHVEPRTIVEEWSPCDIVGQWQISNRDASVNAFLQPLLTYSLGKRE